MLALIGNLVKQMIATDMIIILNIFSNNVHDGQGKGMTMIIHTYIYNDIHRINRHTLMLTIHTVCGSKHSNSIY